MGNKKNTGKKGEKGEKQEPIATVVKDACGVKYQLSPINPNTDVNFYKVFYPGLGKALSGIMNKKLELVLWLVKNMTLMNELKYSYREIAKLSGISYQTVAETMKALTKSDFIRRNGKTLMVNPDAVFRGRLDKRNAARAFYYRITPPKKKPQEDALGMKDKKSLERELMAVDKEMERLKKKKEHFNLQLLLAEKERAAQTSEPNPKPEEEKKDDTGQTSEPETYFY